MATRVARAFAFIAAAAALSACMHPNARSEPRPMVPDEGPRGTVTVDYSGGAFARQIEPRFRMEKAGYALVAHLGGDGRIRVLYPETPEASSWVAGGKTIRLKAQTAMWDVSPHLYSYATAPYRSMSAQLESYDGLGHGYVFLITSNRGFNLRALAGRDGFDEFAVEDYEDNQDPRAAIREFADQITFGRRYAIRFARRQTGSLYAASTVCPTHWGLWSYGVGFTPWLGMGHSFLPHPGASLIQSMAFWRYHSLQSCRGSQYALGRLFVPTTVTGPGPGTSPGPLTPRLQRPTRRTLEGQRTRILTAGTGGRSGDDAGRPGSETLSHRRPRGGGDPFGNRERTTLAERTRSHEGSHGTDVSRGRETASRPTETPRLTTPAAPPQTTTTTTSTTGSETKAQRPRP